MRRILRPKSIPKNVVVGISNQSSGGNIAEKYNEITKKLDAKERPPLTNIKNNQVDTLNLYLPRELGFVLKKTKTGSKTDGEYRIESSTFLSMVLNLPGLIPLIAVEGVKKTFLRDFEQVFIKHMRMMSDSLCKVTISQDFSDMSGKRPSEVINKFEEIWSRTTSSHYANDEDKIEAYYMRLCSRMRNDELLVKYYELREKLTDSEILQFVDDCFYKMTFDIKRFDSTLETLNETLKDVIYIKILEKSDTELNNSLSDNDKTILTNSIETTIMRPNYENTCKTSRLIIEVFKLSEILRGDSSVKKSGIIISTPQANMLRILKHIRFNNLAGSFQVLFSKLEDVMNDIHVRGIISQPCLKVTNTLRPFLSITTLDSGLKYYIESVLSVENAEVMWNRLTCLKGKMFEKLCCDNRTLSYYDEDEKDNIDTIFEELGLDVEILDDKDRKKTPDAFFYDVFSNTLQLYEFGWVTNVVEKMDNDRKKWDFLIEKSNKKMLIIESFDELGKYEYLNVKLNVFIKSSSDLEYWDQQPPIIKELKNSICECFRILRPMLTYDMSEDLYSLLSPYKFRSRKIIKNTKVRIDERVLNSLENKVTEALEIGEVKIWNKLDDDYEKLNIESFEDTLIEHSMSNLRDDGWRITSKKEMKNVLDDFLKEILSPELVERLNTSEHLPICNYPYPTFDKKNVSTYKKLKSNLPQKKQNYFRKMGLKSKSLVDDMFIIKLFDLWECDFFLTQNGKFGYINDNVREKIKESHGKIIFYSKVIMRVNCQSCIDMSNHFNTEMYCKDHEGNFITNDKTLLDNFPCSIKKFDLINFGLRINEMMNEISFEAKILEEIEELTNAEFKMKNLSDMKIEKKVEKLVEDKIYYRDINKDELLDYILESDDKLDETYMINQFISLLKEPLGDDEELEVNFHKERMCEYLLKGETIKGSIGMSCKEIMDMYRALFEYKIGFYSLFLSLLADAFIAAKAEYKHTPFVVGSLQPIGNICLVAFNKCKIEAINSKGILSSNGIIETCWKLEDETINPTCTSQFNINSRHALMIESIPHLLVSFLVNIHSISNTLTTHQIIPNSIPIILFMTHNNRQCNILTQNIRYFIMSLLSTNYRKKLPKKLSAKLKSIKDVFILKEVVDYYKSLIDIYDEMCIKIPSGFVFKQKILMTDIEIMSNFDGMLLSMYLNHFFTKSTDDPYKEIEKVFIKFAEPKMEASNFDLLRKKAQNGFVSESTSASDYKQQLDYIDSVEDKNSMFCESFVIAAYKSYVNEKENEWLNKNVYSTSATELCNSNSTIANFHSEIDYSLLKKTLERDELSKLLLKNKKKFSKEDFNNILVSNNYIINSEDREEDWLESSIKSSKKEISRRKNKNKDINKVVDVESCSSNITISSDDSLLCEKWILGESSNKQMREFFKDFIKENLYGFYGEILEVLSDLNVGNIQMLLEEDLTLSNRITEYVESLSKNIMLCKAIIINALKIDMVKFRHLIKQNTNIYNDYDFNVIVGISYYKSKDDEKLISSAITSLITLLHNNMHSDVSSLLKKSDSYKFKNSRRTTSDLLFALSETIDIDENTSCFALMKKLGYDDSPIKFGIAHKQQLGGERELSLTNLVGKITLRTIESLGRAISSTLKESCLNNKRNETDYLTFIKNQQDQIKLNMKSDMNPHYDPEQGEEMFSEFITLIDVLFNKTKTIKKYLNAVLKLKSKILSDISQLTSIISKFLIRDKNLSSNVKSGLNQTLSNLIIIKDKIEKLKGKSNSSSKKSTGSVIEADLGEFDLMIQLMDKEQFLIPEIFNWLFDSFRQIISTHKMFNNLFERQVETPSENDVIVRTLFESSDHRTWGPNMHPLHFYFIFHRFDGSLYKDVFKYVLGKHLIKHHEIPFLMVKRILKKDSNNYDLTELEEWTHNILKQNKGYISSTNDMGQGMLHNLSDVHGAVITQYCSRISKKIILSMNDELMDVSIRDITTSDDYGSCITFVFKKNTLKKKIVEIQNQFLNLKWSLQRYGNMFCSDKSVAGWTVSEFKSRFVSSGRLRDVLIKMTSSQLMIQRTCSPDGNWNACCSYSQACLSNNGSLSACQLIMNAGNYRVTKQLLTDKGGLNRFHEDKFNLPPILSGFPIVGLSEILTSCTPYIWIENCYNAVMCEGCLDHKKCRLFKSLASCFSATVGKDYKEKISLSTLMNVHMVVPRRSNDIRNLFSVKKKRRILNTEQNWFEDYLDLTYNPDILQGFKLRTSQAFFSFSEKTLSNVDPLIVYRKLRHFALGSFIKTADSKLRMSWKDLTIQYNEENIKNFIKFYNSHNKDIFSFSNECLISDRLPVTQVQPTFPDSFICHKRQILSISEINTNNDTAISYAAYLDQKSKTSKYLNKIPENRVNFSVLNADVMYIINLQDLKELSDADLDSMMKDILTSYGQECNIYLTPGEYLGKKGKSDRETLCNLIKSCTLIRKLIFFSGEAFPSRSFEFRNITETMERKRKYRVFESYCMMISYFDIPKDSKVVNILNVMATLMITTADLKSEVLSLKESKCRRLDFLMALCSFIGDENMLNNLYQSTICKYKVQSRVYNNYSILSYKNNFIIGDLIYEVSDDMNYKAIKIITLLTDQESENKLKEGFEATLRSDNINLCLEEVTIEHTVPSLFNSDSNWNRNKMNMELLNGKINWYYFKSSINLIEQMKIEEERERRRIIVDEYVKKKVMETGEIPKTTLMNNGEKRILKGNVSLRLKISLNEFSDLCKCDGLLIANLMRLDIDDIISLCRMSNKVYYYIDNDLEEGLDVLEEYSNYKVFKGRLVDRIRKNTYSIIDLMVYCKFFIKLNYTTFERDYLTQEEFDSPFNPCFYEEPYCRIYKDQPTLMGQNAELKRIDGGIECCMSKESFNLISVLLNEDITVYHLKSNNVKFILLDVNKGNYTL